MQFKIEKSMIIGCHDTAEHVMLQYISHHFSFSLPG